MVKKILILILLVLSINIVGCSKVLDNLGINNGPGDLGVLIWPDTELSNMLPKPKTESNVGRVEELTDDTFMVHVGGVSEEYFDEYVGECILFGFNKNLSFKDNVFTAKNAAGYSLHMKYSKNVMSIKLESPVLFDDDTNNEGNNELVNDFSNVFPGATKFVDITSTLTIDPASGVSAVYKETSGQGYVFVASKAGFSSHNITVTVGVDNDGKIVGITVDYENPNDFKVNDKTINSFIGKDSTLVGIELTASATVSSNTIKEAVEAGFKVLAENKLLKMTAKQPEKIFEELLPTVTSGFVTGNNSQLDVSGNIYTAFKSLNNSCLVCYVEAGYDKLLAIANVSGNVVLYKANLVDEATQTYGLVDVTAENAALVNEVSTFAATNITSLYSTLSSKITRMYTDVAATDITEVEITTYGSIVAAASFTIEGNIWNAYLAYSINTYNNSVVKTYVVIDHEGKIAKVDIIGLFDDEEYFGVAHGFNEAGYENGFTGNTDFVDTNVISGATMTTNAIKQAVKDAFAEFANLY